MAWNGSAPEKRGRKGDRPSAATRPSGRMSEEIARPDGRAENKLRPSFIPIQMNMQPITHSEAVLQT